VPDNEQKSKGAPPREIRICWQGGHGLWFPGTYQNRVALNAHVFELNTKYGVGTHWLEERDA
jgi:hypothetical protein